MWNTEFRDGNEDTSMEGFSIKPEIDFVGYLLGDFREDFYYHGGTVSKTHIDNLNLTDFATEKIARIFSDSEYIPLEWEWGEIFAVSQIEKLVRVQIPWPVNRDKRAKNASLPGPDIIGLSTRNGSVHFVFGEIKTSSEKEYPPSVVTNPNSGLIPQLKRLAYGDIIEPIKWLLHKADGQEWASDFCAALESWASNNESILVIGALIRDTAPTEKDLRRALDEIGNSCRVGVRLLAFYLPISIKECSEITCSGGGADIDS